MTQIYRPTTAQRSFELVSHKWFLNRNYSSHMNQKRINFVINVIYVIFVLPYSFASALIEDHSLIR